MSAWLRGNRWFLLALVVLIPAAFVASLIPRFLPYLEQQPQPETVARGEVVRYSGADIELTELRVLDGQQLDAPAGADVVVATLAIDVVEPPASSLCELTLVSTEHGAERTWDAELFPDSDYEIPERFAQTCDLSQAGSYDLQATFLVPHGQVTAPMVEVNSSAGLPRVLRLN